MQNIECLVSVQFSVVISLHAGRDIWGYQIFMGTVHSTVSM